MNGVHDMGGMHGFGPIGRDEAAFHGRWAKVVQAMNRIVRAEGQINIDEFRHGIERMAPAAYLAADYYERHLFTLELNLIEKGLISQAEVEMAIERARSELASPVPRREDPALLARVRARAPLPPPRQKGATGRFQPGDAVVTRNVHPTGHTRLPRYARGKRGAIDRFHGVDTLPDASAHGRPHAEPLYSVRFEGRELWGDSAEPRHVVYIDLWESYLEAAG